MRRFLLIAFLSVPFFAAVGCGPDGTKGTPPPAPNSNMKPGEPPAPPAIPPPPKDPPK